MRVLAHMKDVKFFCKKLVSTTAISKGSYTSIRDIN